MMLSPNFSLAEAVLSQTAARRGIRNVPSARVLANMKATAQRFEIVRNDVLKVPCNVNSWFRSKALNVAIGGSPTSDHIDGFAIDFTAPQFGTPIEVCRAIVKSGIKFDQLIYEGTWVHISFAPAMRQQVLTMRRGKYFAGLR